MIYLYTTLYDEKDLLRKNEIYCSVHQNINNPLIDKIFLLDESNDPIINEKITNIKVNTRPTFNDFFRIINQNTGNYDINIIANSDIFFDESLQYVSHYKNGNLVFALTRWNMERMGLKLQDTYFYSQDSWIFFGRIFNINGDFSIGMVGCDNKLAYEIKNANYKIKNPSLTIRSIHSHKISFKNSYQSNVPDRISPPYFYPLPTFSRFDRNKFQPSKIKLQITVILYWIFKLYLNKPHTIYRKVRKAVIEFFRKYFPSLLLMFKKIHR
jgi:hypothetical protein